MKKFEALDPAQKKEQFSLAIKDLKMMGKCAATGDFSLKGAGFFRKMTNLATVLFSLYGAVLAKPGVANEIADGLTNLKSKGQVTLPDLKDFKKDLPAPEINFDDDLDVINKLMAEAAKERTVQEKAGDPGSPPRR